MPKRRSHTPEFKAQVALDALTSRKTLAEVAADHNLHPVQVCQWKRQAVKHLADIFRHSNLTYDAEPAEQFGLQLARLEQTNASLREELDWLKKKLYSYNQPILRSALEPDHQCISLRRQCELLGATRSSYYYHPMIIGLKHRGHAHLIDDLCADNPEISSRDLLTNLHSHGIRICKDQLDRLLCRMGFAPFERKLIKEFGRQLAEVSPPPWRQDEVLHAGEQWILDIAYWPARGVDRFAAILVDAGSRKSLSWGLADSLSPDLVTGTLRRALEKHPLPLTLRSETLLPYLSQRCLADLRQKGISLVKPHWLDQQEGTGRATILAATWRGLKQCTAALRACQPQASEEWLLHQAIIRLNDALSGHASSGKNLPGLEAPKRLMHGKAFNENWCTAV